MKLFRNVWLLTSNSQSTAHSATEVEGEKSQSTSAAIIKVIEALVFKLGQSCLYAQGNSCLVYKATSVAAMVVDTDQINRSANICLLGS